MLPTTTTKNQSHLESIFDESSYEEGWMHFDEGLESVWLAKILSYLHIPNLNLEKNKLNQNSCSYFDAEYISDANLCFVRWYKILD